MTARRLLNHSMLYLMGNVIRRGVGFVMLPLYTHYLTPADYGVIELVELLVSITSLTFGVSAVGDSMVRIYHDDKDGIGRQTTVSTALAIVAAISAAAAAITISMRSHVSMWVFGTTSYGGLLSAALVAMVFSSITETGLIYQRLQQRPVLFVSFSTSQLALNLGLNVYFIVVLRTGVWGFVLSKLIYSTLAAIVTLWLVFRDFPPRFSKSAAKAIALFGWPLIVSSVAFFEIHFADRFFLSRAGTLADVGVYALAYRFAFLITFVVGEPFGNVWNVTLYARTAMAGWKQEFRRVAKYLMFFLFLAGLTLSLFIRPVLSLVASSAFSAAALVVPVLSLGYIFREIGDFFRGMLFINKRVLQFGWIVVGCAVLNLILNWLLIGRYKAMGAALATAFTWAAYMGVSWYQSQREHHIPSLSKPFTALATGACVLFALAAAGTESLTGWGRIVPYFAFVAFVAFAWSSNVFEPSERDTVREYFISGYQQLVRMTAIRR